MDNAFKSKESKEVVRCFPKCKSTDLVTFASDCIITKYIVNFYNALGQKMAVAAPFKISWNMSTGYSFTYDIPASDGAVFTKTWLTNRKVLKGQTMYFCEDGCDYATLCPGGFAITCITKPL